MTERLAEDLRWFLDHQDQAPERIHTRGVWRVPEETVEDPDTGLRMPTAWSGLGSVLGSPEDSREFRDWLERGEWARQREQVKAPCPHPTQTRRERDRGELCPTCGVRDADGRLIAETGTIERQVERYRWPLRAAMSKTRGVTVKRGRPNLATTLAAIARANGDLPATIEALMVPYPVMGDPATARAHLAFALAACRQRFREEAQPRRRSERELSDAQADAEAAGRTSGHADAVA